MLRVLFRFAALVCLLPCGCSRAAPSDSASTTPFRLSARGCLADADAGTQSGWIEVSTVEPGHFACRVALDERAVGKLQLAPQPASGQIFVDGTPTTEIELPLLPLVADEKKEALGAWHPKDAERAALRARIGKRSEKSVEVRGGGRTDKLTLRVIDLETSEATRRALVKAAAKTPAKPSADPKKGIYLLAASGRTLIAGRRDLTYGDFDWLAVEEETSRKPVTECTYTNGQRLPLVAVGTKVVVTTRDGKPVAEKVFPPPKDARCDGGVFTVNGVSRTEPSVRYPDVTAWLDELAASPPKN